MSSGSSGRDHQSAIYDQDAEANFDARPEWTQRQRAKSSDRKRVEESHNLVRAKGQEPEANERSDKKNEDKKVVGPLDACSHLLI